MQIDLGGKTRRIEYGIGAIRAMEREAGGIGLHRLLSEERMGVDTVCLLVWAGLRHENKKLSAEQVETWLEDYLDKGGTLEALMIIVIEALKKVAWLKIGDAGNAEAGAVE